MILRWDATFLLSRGLSTLVVLGLACLAAPAQSLPRELARWLGPQQWEKHRDGPVIALGKPGAFDDMHIFAPGVIRENGRFLLWYPGSRGTVADRVFHLGLAAGGDGVHFEKQGDRPVFEFGDGRHSVVTPTLLRETDGRPIRESGRLRMWFTAVDFNDGLHTLHETSGHDARRWAAPSPPLLEHCYAPTIIKDNGVYRLWYTDVEREPWVFRHAQSRDGTRWEVTPEPVMVVDQPWEHRRLFYPTVVKADGVYLMWYASYWIEKPADKTAIGFAVSPDGLTWHKHPTNPVLRPDPELPWESHYNSSQSVMRLPDGTWRLWYGSRKQPPYVNKYFAICTAAWGGPR